MDEVHYHYVPPGDTSYQGGTVIQRLPYAETNLDRVYAVLLTSDQLQAHPHSMGAINAEHVWMRSVLHALFSVAISHRDNLAAPLPGYARLPRAHLVSRAFVPDPNHPDDFAILLQVVIGAQNVPNFTRDPNVSSRTALAPPGASVGNGSKPVRARGSRPAVAAVDAIRGAFEMAFGGAPNVAEEEDEEGGAMDEEGGGAPPQRGFASQPMRNLVVAIEDLPSYLSLRLRESARRRFSECANAARLFPVFIKGDDTSRAPSTAGSWDLMKQPEAVGYSQYMHDLLQPLLAAGYESLVHERSSLSTESALEPLVESTRGALEEGARDEDGLWFSPENWIRMTAVRWAFSLPTALRALRRWTENGRAGASDVNESWFRLSSYAHRRQTAHSSPRNCFVTVEAVQDAERAGLSLEHALLRPLPLCHGLTDVLRSAACQLTLMRTTRRGDFLMVMDNATALGLCDDVWLPGVRARYADEVRRGGSLQGRSRVMDKAALLRFVMTRFNLIRSIPTEIGALQQRTVTERTELLRGCDQPEPWHLALLQQQTLRDFEMLMASGRDGNVIGWATHCYFALGCEPGSSEHATLGRGIDVQAELAVFRRVFAGRIFSDLTDPSAMLAKLGIVIRSLTGLVQLWPENLLVLLFVLSSYIDAGERPHLEISGMPASGKTATLVAIVDYLPDQFARTYIYRSMASNRDPTGSKYKNVPEVYPESGNRGDFPSNDERAVVLSNMSESKQTSQTVRMDPVTGKRMLETCTQLRSNSCIFATNIPTTDAAFTSRMMVMRMAPLAARAQFYGEMRAENKSQHDPELHATTHRAMVFFIRCVAAYCMLVNCGAVQAPVNSLNVAVLNRLLPADTDASGIRAYLQLLKLCRTLECMHAVFRFLSDPRSPLTMLFNDRLDLNALCQARVFDTPHCSIPVYIASAAQRLQRPHMLPQIVNTLMATALRPTFSDDRAAATEFDREARRCGRQRSSDGNTRWELRALHLQFLPRLFRQRAVTRNDALPSEKPIFFRWSNIHPGAHPKSGATRASDAPRSGDIASRFDVYLQPEGAQPTAAAPLRPPDEHAGGSAMDDELLELMAHAEREESLHAFQMLTPLEGEDAERATAEFVQMLLSHGRGKRSIASTAATRSSAGPMKLRRSDSRVERPTGAPDSAHVGPDDGELVEALRRLRLRFYSHGYASVDATCLDCDESSRLRRQLEALSQEYSMQPGGYVIFGYEIPHRRRGAEAMPMLTVSGTGSRSLSEALDVEGGQSQSRLRHDVARSLVYGTDCAPAVRPEPMELTVDGIHRHAVTDFINLAYAGLRTAHPAVLEATSHLLESEDTSSTLAALAASLFPSDGGRSWDDRMLQELCDGLTESGVGQWGTMRVHRGKALPYHEFEARQSQQSDSPPCATSTSSNTRDTPSPDNFHTTHKRTASVMEDIDNDLLSSLYAGACLE